MAQLRSIKWLFLSLLLAAPLNAAPTVSGVAGTINHGNSCTVTGGSFGTKGAAAPTIWDNGEHGQAVTVRWSSGWPNLSGAPYDIDYRSTQRSIGQPHSHSTKYLAGCHFPNTGFNSGYNVMVYKNVTVSSFPQDYFLTYYERVDDAWNDGSSDNNFKIFDYAQGTEPFLPNNWYLNFAPPVSHVNPQLQMNDDSVSVIENPDQNGHNVYWSVVPAPWSGVWKKIEIWLRISNTSSVGFFKRWEDGSLKVDYKGKTDGWSGTTRTIGVGGYARSQNNTNNYRYLDDISLDVTAQRVAIGNANTWAASNVREFQPATAWADNSVSVTINQGPFANGTTAYMYVLDSNNTPNATGFSFVFGTTGGSGNTAPTVSAGPDLSIALPGTVSLDGDVTDDGLPSGTLTKTWSKVSGPGTVTFTDASAIDTPALLSTAGTYVLKLSATDGSLTTEDTMTVTVGAAPTPNNNARGFGGRGTLGGRGKAGRGS